MKKFKFLLAFLMLSMLTISCSKTNPNYTGVLRENFGRNGKQDFKIVYGRIWTFWPGTTLYEVPQWQQRAGYESRSTLKDGDNTELYVTPKYSYKIIPEKAINVVFNNANLKSGISFSRALEDNVLEAWIYDIIKEEAKSVPTDSLMKKGGNLLFEQIVQEKIRQKFDSIGVQLITFSTNLDYDEAVKKKIVKRNEISTNISVIDQNIIEQKKRNELAELVAQENIIRSRGLTEEILREKAIDRWDGRVYSVGQNTIMGISFK